MLRDQRTLKLLFSKGMVLAPDQPLNFVMSCSQNEKKKNHWFLGHFFIAGTHITDLFLTRLTLPLKTFLPANFQMVWSSCAKSASERTTTFEAIFPRAFNAGALVSCPFQGTCVPPFSELSVRLSLFTLGRGRDVGFTKGGGVHILSRNFPDVMNLTLKPCGHLTTTEPLMLKQVWAFILACGSFQICAHQVYRLS